MNVVIIEDELDAFKRLSKLVKETFEKVSILAHLDSVQSTKEWFAQHPMPDLVFIDINLGDGTGFDVLNLVDISCPYVFVTAYDQYAIDAFSTNSIAYLLKPVTKEDLEAVLKKLQDLPKLFGVQQPQKLARPSGERGYKKRFIIKLGVQIKVVGVEEIAYLYSQGGFSFIRTHDGRSFPIDHSLDVLQEMLDPKVFFRINRQYLACLKAIGNMQVYNKARIIVTLVPSAQDQPVVSSERSAEFRHWLEGDD